VKAQLRRRPDRAARQTDKPMKTAKLLILGAVLVGAMIGFTGCASCKKCCAAKPSCTMKCCSDAGKTCADCEKCSPKK